MDEAHMEDERAEKSEASEEARRAEAPAAAHAAAAGTAARKRGWWRAVKAAAKTARLKVSSAIEILFFDIRTLTPRQRR
jgi:hypothetical protein